MKQRIQEVEIPLDWAFRAMAAQSSEEWCSLIREVCMAGADAIGKDGRRYVYLPREAIPDDVWNAWKQAELRKKHASTGLVTGHPLLDTLIGTVSKMLPGENLAISRNELEHIPGYFHNDAFFGGADRILGNIIGSSFTHSVTHCPRTGAAIITRHEDTGKRRYEAPDRREGSRQ